MEELKNECIKRLQILKLDSKVIDDFKNDNKIYTTKINKDLTEVILDDNIRDLVEFVERNKTLKIYHTIRTGNNIYILCVHNHKEAWKSERAELKRGFSEAITGDCNVRNIGIDIKNGKITRVVTWKSKLEAQRKATEHTQEKIEYIKKKYIAGTKVELIKMYDFQAVPTGTKGIIEYVDDIGTIHVNWENGSGLGLVVGVDEFKIIEGEEQ